MKNDIQKQPGSVWKLVVKSEESLIYEGPLDTFLQKENLKDLEAVIQYCEESDFTATVTNTIKARPTEEELMEMERQPPVATIVCPTPFTKGGIDGSGILKMESNCWEESSPGWKFKKGDTIQNKEGRIGVIAGLEPTESNYFVNWESPGREAYQVDREGLERECDRRS